MSNIQTTFKKSESPRKTAMIRNSSNYPKRNLEIFHFKFCLESKLDNDLILSNLREVFGYYLIQFKKTSTLSWMIQTSVNYLNIMASQIPNIRKMIKEGSEFIGFFHTLTLMTSDEFQSNDDLEFNKSVNHCDFILSLHQQFKNEEMFAAANLLFWNFVSIFVAKRKIESESHIEKQQLQQ